MTKKVVRMPQESKSVDPADDQPKEVKAQYLCDGKIKYTVYYDEETTQMLSIIKTDFNKHPDAKFAILYDTATMLDRKLQELEGKNIFEGADAEKKKKFHIHRLQVAISVLNELLMAISPKIAGMNGKKTGKPAEEDKSKSLVAAKD